jgi:hypothetical protein
MTLIYVLAFVGAIAVLWLIVEAISTIYILTHLDKWF